MQGYAFVEVINLTNAEQFMDALGGTMIDGRELTINIVKEVPTPVNIFSQKPGQCTYSSRLKATNTKRPRITKSRCTDHSINVYRFFLIDSAYLLHP